MHARRTANLSCSNAQEASQERAIRPLSLIDYVGQAEVKEQMDIFINAARNRSESQITLLFSVLLVWGRLPGEHHC